MTSSDSSELNTLLPARNLPDLSDEYDPEDSIIYYQETVSTLNPVTGKTDITEVWKTISATEIMKRLVLLETSLRN